jgi:hypothetical protein
VDYSSRLAVQWNTLTAWLKEQHTKGRELPPLEPIGGHVGQVVEIKERK